MLKRKFYVIGVLFIFQAHVYLFAQNDEFHQRIEQAGARIDSEKRSLSKEERKFDSGLLLHIPRLSEQADTSVQASEELKSTLAQFTHLNADSSNRISIVLKLESNSDTSYVVSLIQSNRGIIEVVGKAKYIRCRIHPNGLRALISDDSVRFISTLIPECTSSGVGP